MVAETFDAWKEIESGGRGMNRLYSIRTVAGKELVDFVRDWRTIAALLLVPLIIFPMIFIAVPWFLSGEAAELELIDLDVVVYVDENSVLPGSLEQHLNESRISVQSYVVEFEDGKHLGNHSMFLNEASESIENGSNHATLLLRKTEGNATENWDFVVFSDSTDELSREAFDRIILAVDIWEDEIINATLNGVSLTYEDVRDPVGWDSGGTTTDVATSGEQAAFAFAMFVPFIIALWTATSAVQPSIDLTAGERERGTLEALLCTPIRRDDLMWGKWLAVAIIASASVLFQMVGLFAAIHFLAGGFFSTPSVSFEGWVMFLMTIILFAVFVVAVEMAIAMRARSVKEAGSTLGPVIILFIGPALFAQFVNMESIELWWFIAPVFNISLGMRASLLDDFTLLYAVLWMGSSILYALAATAWASRQFNREDLVESIS